MPATVVDAKRAQEGINSGGGTGRGNKTMNVSPARELGREMIRDEPWEHVSFLIVLLQTQVVAVGACVFSDRALAKTGCGLVQCRCVSFLTAAMKSSHGIRGWR